MTLYSVFIPRVFSNITEKRIINTFHNLDIGDVHHVDLVKRTNINGKSYNMAFVHFNGFYDTKSAESFKTDIENKDKKAKIVYDDPWFWLVLPFEMKPQVNNNNNLPQFQPLNHYQPNFCFPVYQNIHPMYQPVMFYPLSTTMYSQSQKNKINKYNQPKVRIDVSKLSIDDYKKNNIVDDNINNNHELEEGEILDNDTKI
jgi:hypothetical protein